MAKDSNQTALFISVAIVLAGIVIGAAIYYSGGSGDGGSGSLITITATGTASTTGGQADLYLYMNGSGSTTGLAVENLSKTINSVNSTLLKYINGNTSLITTQYFNVYKAYNKSSYVAYESLLVTIPNAKNATGALISLSAIPNVYINNIMATLSDNQTSALRSQALATAIANATAQAKAVSPTGRVILTNITVNYYRIYPYPLPYGLAGTSVSPQAAAAQLNNSLFYSGTSSVTESVSAVFRAG